MIRRTSVEAYNYILENGILGERQRHAYQVLYQHGPLTGNELSKLMNYPGQWKRCSELKKRGLAMEVGERVCSVTGHNAYLWDVTENYPNDYDPKIARDKNKLIADLCDVIDEMSGHLDAQGEKVPDKWRSWNDRAKDIVLQCKSIREKSNRKRKKGSSH